MGGHIDCYIDCSSLYSYIAFVYLRTRRDTLASHGVTVDFIPVFLGGINRGSGNKPPWTLPAKATYGQFDSDRALAYHGLDNVKTPAFFPPVTLLPQRALCYIKANFSNAVYEDAYLAILTDLWNPPHANVTIPGELTSVLQKMKLFSDAQVEAILTAATTQEYKDKLNGNTQAALDLGAFGAPWMWVREDATGKQEPFFGSDRFHFIWEFLGLPYQDLEVLSKGQTGSVRLKSSKI